MQETRLPYYYLIFFGSSSFLFSRIFLSLILNYYGNEWGYSLTMIGLHFSFIALGGICFSLLAPFLIDQISSKKIVFSLILLSFSLGLLVWFQEKIITLAVYFLVGGFGSLTMVLLMTKVADQKEKVNYIQKINIIGALAAVVSPIIINFTISPPLSDWRYGALFLLVLFLFFALKIDHRYKTKHHHLFNQKLSLKEILIFINVGILIIAEWSFIFWGPLYLSQLNLEIGSLSMFSITIYTASILIGRIGYDYFSSYISRNKIIYGSFIGQIIALFLLVELPQSNFFLNHFSQNSSVVLFSIIVFLGLSTANLFPIHTTKIFQQIRLEKVIISSYMMITSGILSVGIPFVFGLISDHFGIDLGFYLIIFFIFLSIGIFFYFNSETERK